MRKEASAVLMLSWVPVKLMRVKLGASEYPVLAEIPEVFPNRKVVPLGGFTNPIVINKVEDALNPEIENPVTF
jgi:hypothetical protein